MRIRWLEGAKLGCGTGHKQEECYAIQIGRLVLSRVTASEVLCFSDTDDRHIWQVHAFHDMHRTF